MGTAVQPASSPWVSVPAVTVNLPVGSVPGQNVWLRPGPIQFQFSATGGANPAAAGSGVTNCVPINPAEVLAGSTVLTPIYGIYSRVNAPSPTHVALDGTPPPPPVANCTAQTGNQTGGTGCTTTQNVNALLTPGNLAMSEFQTGINPSSSQVLLGSVVVASTTQTMTGQLNRVQVTDERGGTFGWTLSGALTGPFLNGSGQSIAASQLSITGLICPGDVNSAPSTPGAGGSLGSSVTFCSVAAGALGPNQSGSGVYDVGGLFQLAVPSFQHVGDYNATLTITLV